jgi:hypothetical protein
MAIAAATALSNGSSPDSIASRLGRALLAGASLFWLGRLVEQFVFLRVNRTLVHMLSALFALGAVLFALPLVLRAHRDGALCP